MNIINRVQFRPISLGQDITKVIDFWIIKSYRLKVPYTYHIMLLGLLLHGFSGIFVSLQHCLRRIITMLLSYTNDDFMSSGTVQVAWPNRLFLCISGNSIWKCVLHLVCMLHLRVASCCYSISMTTK